MEVTNYKCDICGERAEGDTYNGPKGWFTIYRRTDKNREDDKDFWSDSRDICPECAAPAIKLLVPHPA